MLGVGRSKGWDYGHHEIMGGFIPYIKCTNSVQADISYASCVKGVGISPRQGSLLTPATVSVSKRAVIPPLPSHFEDTRLGQLKRFAVAVMWVTEVANKSKRQPRVKGGEPLNFLSLNVSIWYTRTMSIKYSANYPVTRGAIKNTTLCQSVQCSDIYQCFLPCVVRVYTSVINCGNSIRISAGYTYPIRYMHAMLGSFIHYRVQYQYKGLPLKLTVSSGNGDLSCHAVLCVSSFSGASQRPCALFMCIWYYPRASVWVSFC